jgi:hypothetical protein
MFPFCLFLSFYFLFLFPFSVFYFSICSKKFTFFCFSRLFGVFAAPRLLFENNLTDRHLPNWSFGRHSHESVIWQPAFCSNLMEHKFKLHSVPFCTGPAKCQPDKMFFDRKACDLLCISIWNSGKTTIFSQKKEKKKLLNFSTQTILSLFFAKLNELDC